MRKRTAGWILSMVPVLALAQEECGGIRIDYEASIPSVNIAMAPWSEVPRNFPESRGITSRAVYVTPDRLVTVERGKGIKMTISKTLSPAPGVHFRDRTGREILAVGYEQVPLHFISIDSANERIRYNSLTGKVHRGSATEPDSDTMTALLALEETAESIGEREYAGHKCTAKRIPMQGSQTEACVRKYYGWPVALYLQFDLPENGGLQWYRAMRITEGACIRKSEFAVPADAKVIDRRRKASE